ncbi:MAG TPA: hypothetical protein VGP72_09130 [Planctomycetota bacterium]|jgi:hypothetical protein
MRNIVVGVIFILGGLSGQLALRGTDSSIGLAVVGFVLVGWGIYQVTQSDERRSPSKRTGVRPKNPFRKPAPPKQDAESRR